MNPNMNFSEALERLKEGARIQRDGWNGKGMFLFYIEDWQWAGAGIDGNVADLPTQPFVAMKTADNKVIPWLASQADLLADDWSVLYSVEETSET